MSNIFTWESQDIDLKECIKLKTNCQQNDTMILQFNVYDYDIPVDLTNFNVSFVAKKPDGTIYGQAENIVKTNNLLKITCNEQLTSITGRVIGTLVITDNNGNRKGSYFIVLNVFGILNDDDRVVSKNFVDVLNRFDEDVAIALSLSNKFEQDINTAQIISDDFAEKIPLAQSTDNTLNNTIDEANSINNILTNTNSTANTLENKLTSDITIGSTLKNNLLLNISTAGQKNDELTLTVESADNKLQEFKNYDTTQLVPLSNTMLNEMHCNKELLSLNHGLNGYPIAKMTYTEFGGGVGGAGDFPSGADSDCNLMQNKLIYHDSNNMTIFVPQNYYIANPTVNKINDYKYTVTFINSTRSILIELIEGGIQNQVNENLNNLTSEINQIDNKLDDKIYQTAGGTATVITLTIKGILINGYPITFIASANNGGSATTINGKHLYKPSTTISPVLIKDKAYTVWYNSIGDCFFIKASAEGTALASDVRKNKTFSNDNDTGVVGGLDLSLLTSDNLRSGITIDGVIGKASVVDTADATVLANHILSPETAYKNGIKVIGTMVDRSGDTTCVSSSISGTTLKLKASEGYRDGVNDNVTITDANFMANNIINGKNIFGIDGNAPTYKYATGSLDYVIPGYSGTASDHTFYSYTVNPNFEPTLVIWVQNNNPTVIYTFGSLGTVKPDDFYFYYSESLGGIRFESDSVYSYHLNGNWYAWKF